MTPPASSAHDESLPRDIHIVIADFLAGQPLTRVADNNERSLVALLALLNSPAVAALLDTYESLTRLRSRLLSLEARVEAVDALKRFSTSMSISSRARPRQNSSASTSQASPLHQRLAPHLPPRPARLPAPKCPHPKTPHPLRPRLNPRPRRPPGPLSPGATPPPNSAPSPARTRPVLLRAWRGILLP